MCGAQCSYRADRIIFPGQPWTQNTWYTRFLTLHMFWKKETFTLTCQAVIFMNFCPQTLRLLSWLASVCWNGKHRWSSPIGHLLQISLEPYQIHTCISSSYEFGLWWGCILAMSGAKSQGLPASNPTCEYSWGDEDWRLDPYSATT